MSVFEVAVKCDARCVSIKYLSIGLFVCFLVCAVYGSGGERLELGWKSIFASLLNGRC